MPIPLLVARLNRVATNPVMRGLADHAPFFATLVHRGRSSGVEYRTPLNVFPVTEGFVVALTYGRDTDWRKNLFAAGQGRLVHRGTEVTVVAPRFIASEEGMSTVPRVVRWLLRRLKVHDFIRVDIEAEGR